MFIFMFMSGLIAALTISSISTEPMLGAAQFRTTSVLFHHRQSSAVEAKQAWKVKQKDSSVRRSRSSNAARLRFGGLSPESRTASIVSRLRSITSESTSCALQDEANNGAASYLEKESELSCEEDNNQLYDKEEES